MMGSDRSPTGLKRFLDDIDPGLTKAFLYHILRHPRYLRSSIGKFRAVRLSKRTRVRALEEGLMVPPWLIMSITSRCNLSCKGCYAAATGTVRKGRSGRSLQRDQWRDIIAEARELGVYGFVIAGGEPFLFPGLIDLCTGFKDNLFLILTNGTALTEGDLKELKRSTNILVIVSIEGGEEMTDDRRGRGVYQRALDALGRLRRIGVPSGISVTITRSNFEYWMEEEHIDELVENGIRIGVFIEYIPLTPGPKGGPDPSILPCSCVPDDGPWSVKDDHALILTPEERAKFRSRMLSYRENKGIYMIHSPGDEEVFGGCVSAGRGFAHVTPAGDLTPCPISNIATHNLTTSSLKEALAGPLFREIRANKNLLETDGLPCALFAHPEEVDELAKAVGAYRTDE